MLHATQIDTRHSSDSPHVEATFEQASEGRWDTQEAYLDALLRKLARKANPAEIRVLNRMFRTPKATLTIADIQALNGILALGPATAC